MTYVADTFAALLAHRRVDGDYENNAILGALVGALADVCDRLGASAFGIDGARGEQVLRDPSKAPLWALAHAALYTGARMPTRRVDEVDEGYLARARDAVVYPLGFHRGTHEAIRRAIQPHLTGTRSVFIADGYGGPYDVFVRTVVGETPDPALIERLLTGDFVSGGEPGAVRAELVVSYAAADYVAWPEATLRWSEVAADVTWTTATREDLT